MKCINKPILILAVFATLLLASNAHALSVLVANGDGYGTPGWEGFSSTLFAETSGLVSHTNTLEGLTAEQMGSDALLVNARAAGATLSAGEVSTIRSFINTGRKVVLLGENVAWDTWNDSILGVVGGTATTNGMSFMTTQAVPGIHPLTTGVTSIFVEGGSFASGGTPLFQQNVVTLWEPQANVLSILDADILSSLAWNLFDNAQFGTNVSRWLADSSAVTPLPGAVWLLGTGLAGIIGLRRRMNR